MTIWWSDFNFKLSAFLRSLSMAASNSAGVMAQFCIFSFLVNFSTGLVKNPFNPKSNKCSAKSPTCLWVPGCNTQETVSYTHLRAHETRHDLVCRLLLEKKK